MTAAAAPDLQPTLTGPTVIVRPVRAEDWEAILAAASDPGIWALHPQSDRWREPVFRRFFDGAVACGSGFAIVDRASGRIIGSSRYGAYDAAAREIEIGWSFLTREFWGGATNAEVKRLLLGHAFTFADTVLFWVGETNWRSQRAMEKIGGVRRPGVFTRALDGGQTKSVVFEIRRRDFQGAQ